LDREGRWYDQGAQVTNPRVAEFLLSHLTKDEDGRYLVHVGVDKRYVEVEDAPYRVLGVEIGGAPETRACLFLRLNDGSREPFDPATFWIGQEGTPYGLVKKGLHKVRFTLEAFRQFSALLTEEAETGRYLLQIGSRRIAVPVVDH
jgi:hypothetical protein